MSNVFVLLTMYNGDNVSDFFRDLRTIYGFSGSYTRGLRSYCIEHLFLGVGDARVSVTLWSGVYNNNDGDGTILANSYFDGGFFLTRVLYGRCFTRAVVGFVYTDIV